MDFCAGGEFFRMLQKQPGKCLIEVAARFYAAEVLLALEYLHMMGFIYRDLKPENILLLANGHLVLSDFDLSKSAGPANPKVISQMFGKDKVSAEPSHVTNSLVGTEEYIAPEVITGFGHTSSVDWWTFGILLYEMLWGCTPFVGKSREETFARILHGDVKFPDPHIHPVSKNAKKIVLELLAADSIKRLGAKNGACDIKEHPFFKDINWTLIRNQTAPMVPQLKSPYDTSYFPTYQDDDLLDRYEALDAAVPVSASEAAKGPFHNFESSKSSHAAMSAPLAVPGQPAASVAASPSTIQSAVPAPAPASTAAPAPPPS
jgi:protein-serine/threonine kinase